jgi:cytosine/adenosine deaminase-related metal-dependent hydrolase
MGNGKRDEGIILQVCDLMVTNGYVLSMDARRTVYPRGAVAIDGARILAVGPEREIVERFAPRRTIDAGGGAVHPGFIDGHYHATLHLTRGAITDHPQAPPAAGEPPKVNAYVAWINALDDEDEHASALMACVEMARNGFTGFMEPGTAFEPDAVARAAEDVGIRVSVADPFLWDCIDAEGMAGQIARAPADARRAERLLGQQLARNRHRDGLARAHVALYGVGTASDALSRTAKACADANEVVLAQHQNFTTEDVDHDTARFGRHPLLHFADIGVLDRNCTFTHMNVIHDDEVGAVVDSGLSIVWHPGNYLFYGISGQMKTRMPALYRAGTNMTFGCDVAKVWAFGELGWLAYLVARENGQFLPSESILEMFTVGGARAMGRQQEIGSLEVGKRADLVIRSNDLPDAQPNLDVVRQLTLVSRTKSVDTVIVDGEIVVRKGRLTRLDEAAVYARAQASGRRMAERTGLHPGTDWPCVD